MSSEFLDLPQLAGAHGTVRLPGSKSISNRVLLLASLAGGVTEVRDLLLSDDTRHMLEALAVLGVRVETLGSETFRVHGVAGTFPNLSGELFLGNAGTAFRPLTAALALSGGSYRLTGVARMHERPIGDLVDALRQLGAEIDYLGQEGFPPLSIRPRRAQTSQVVRLRGNVSSQFLSGLLMALPLCRQATTVEIVGELISRPYVEMTLAMMQRFGVTILHDDWRSFMVPAGSLYCSPGVVNVEGDASSASYFLALGALCGGTVRVEGVGSDSIQGDVRFAEALAAMGVRIRSASNWIEASPSPTGKLLGINLDCNHIPDAAMTLATVALFAEGATTLRNIASWRVKETDRITAMATELRKLGAMIEEGDDWLRVLPPAAGQGLLSAVIDTYDDHRIAMSLSLAAAGAPLRINHPEVVAKTFPDYFERFAAATRRVPVIAVDGTSASGKGTVAARVAQALGWHYLDSGALYRAVALAARKAGITWEDEASVAELAGSLDVQFHDGAMLLAGSDVSDEIRSEEISGGASVVASLPAVRAALLFRQRAFRRAPGLVADGRDMASIVFPDAMLKVFLTASPEIRAKRRHKQLMDKGITVSIDTLLLDLEARDERDSRRRVAPMQRSADAALLDTTDLTIATAVAQVLDWVGNVPEEVVSGNPR